MRKTSLVSEAFEGVGEGADFMAGDCPIVMAYWGAANTDTAYGSPDFNMEVIGFPTERGQMPSALDDRLRRGGGLCGDGAEALKVMDVTDPLGRGDAAVRRD